MRWSPPTALRAAVLLPLLALLAACWTSESPLIDDRSAAYPPLEGTYREAEPAGDEGMTVRITTADDGSFEMDDGNDRQRLVMAALGGDWFVVQWQKLDEDGQVAAAGALYGLMRIEPDRILSYVPDCDDAAVQYAGVVREGETCTFETLGALRDVALDAVERIESDDDIDEPAVLIRVPE